MASMRFRGFGGVRIEGATTGEEDAPPLLLIHAPGHTRGQWADVAEPLAMAGRRVMTIDLRGHGISEWPNDGRYDFDSYVEDVKAVLAQLDVRPVIVASGIAGWMAMAALGEGGTHLAAGLVLVGLPMLGKGEAIGSLADRMRATGAERISPDWDPRVPETLHLSPVPERVLACAARIALPVIELRPDALQSGGLDVAAAVPGVERADVAEVGSDEFNALLLDFLERRVPLAAPEFREGSDARTFRDALGCFATGVTIVTAMSEDGQPIGLTANSFTSVSLDPPLLLVCIANNAGSATVLESADRFAVNVLQIGQQPTSNRFAGRGEDRFAATPWEAGEFGTPLLTGSLASFECARHAVHEGGDHFILVGRVLKARFEPRRDPLLYFRGKYRRLHFA